MKQLAIILITVALVTIFTFVFVLLGKFTIGVDEVYRIIGGFGVVYFSYSIAEKIINNITKSK